MIDSWPKSHITFNASLPTYLLTFVFCWGTWWWKLWILSWSVQSAEVTAAILGAVTTGGLNSLYCKLLFKAYRRPYALNTTIFTLRLSVLSTVACSAISVVCDLLSRDPHTPFIYCDYMFHTTLIYITLDGSPPLPTQKPPRTCCFLPQWKVEPLACLWRCYLCWWLRTNRAF